MADNTRGGPPSRDRKPGGGAPSGGPGGGGNRGGGRERGNGPGGPGGPRKGGKGGFGKGPAKAVRAETYESLKELTRGEGFRIDKFVVAEKGTHRPVKTEYRLTREGLKGTPAFSRLVEAQAAAIAPLPEPEPEPIEEAAPATAEVPEHAAETPAAETPAAETPADETPGAEEGASESGAAESVAVEHAAAS
jgi:hypothetical protein